MKKVLFYLAILGGALVILSGCTGVTPVLTNNSAAIKNQNTSSNLNTLVVNQQSDVNISAHTTSSEYVSPLDRSGERITKKPFGIYITPATSPVQPERFTGYHTGSDFEIFPGEENSAVTIKAFCTGRVVYKQWVSGYGGVFIQQCSVENKTVTVLYGHLKLSSIILVVGNNLKAGDTIGELGQAKSRDTDGERKHLHLAIHIGSTINVKGYVRNQSDLNGWLDPQKYL